MDHLMLASLRGSVTPRTGRCMPLVPMLTAGFLALMPGAHATSYYWDENSATAGFGTAGSGSPSTWAAPTPGGSYGWSTDSTGASTINSVTTTTADFMYFGTDASGLGSGTIDISGSVSAQRLLFGTASGAITLNGGTINFQSGGTSYIWANGGGSASATHTINSAITKPGGGTLRFATQSTPGEFYEVNGIIGGSNFGIEGRPNNGTSYVALNATNTFGGNISFVTGALKANNVADSGVACALGTGSQLAFGGGGGQTPDFWYSGTIAGSMNRTIRMDLTGTMGIQSQDAPLTLTGSVYADVGDNPTLVLSGDAGGGINVISGPMTNPFKLTVSSDAPPGGSAESGRWKLSGANTFDGKVTVANDSLLQIAGATSLGNNDIDINDNATLQIVESGALNGGAYSGILRIGGGTGDSTFEYAVASALEISSVIQLGGAGDSFILNSPAAVTLSAANTYGGDTHLNAGTLVLENELALQSSDLIWPTGGGTLTLDSSVASKYYVLGSLTSTNNITLVNNAAQPIILGVGNNGLDVNYDGVLSGGGALRKLGNGTLTIDHANTHSGGTILSQGTVEVWDAEALGSGTVSFSNSVNATARMNLRQDGMDFDNPLIVPAGDAATGFHVMAAPNPETASVNWSGDIQLNRPGVRNLRFEVGNTGGDGKIELSGTISGPGALSVNQVYGNLVRITGNNTYSGGTYFDGNGRAIIYTSDGLGTGPLIFNGGNQTYMELANGVNIANPIEVIDFNSEQSGNGIGLLDANTGAEYSGSITNKEPFVGDYNDGWRFYANAGTLTNSGELVGNFEKRNGATLVLKGDTTRMTNFRHRTGPIRIASANALDGGTDGLLLLDGGGNNYITTELDNLVVPINVKALTAGTTRFVPQLPGETDDQSITFSGDITADQNHVIFISQVGVVSGPAEGLIFTGNITPAPGVGGLRIRDVGRGVRFDPAPNKTQIVYQIGTAWNGGDPFEIAAGKVLELNNAFSPNVYPAWCGRNGPSKPISGPGQLTWNSDVSSGVMEIDMTCGLEGFSLQIDAPMVPYGNGTSVLQVRDDTDTGNGDGVGAAYITSPDNAYDQVKILSGEFDAPLFNNNNETGPLGDTALAVEIGGNDDGVPSILEYVGDAAADDCNKTIHLVNGTDKPKYIRHDGNNKLTLSGIIEPRDNVEEILTFAVDENAGFDITGTIRDHTSGGALNINKIGRYGMEYVSGATLTYSGSTIISNGLLRLNAVYDGGGNWTIKQNAIGNDYARLEGTGSIRGNLTVEGRLAPGNSIGTLSVTGNVTWAGTQSEGSSADWRWELAAGPTADLLDITGNFTKSGSGSYRFDFTGAPAAAATYNLVQWTGSTTFSAGDFSAIGLPVGYNATFAIVGNILQLTLDAGCANNYPSVTMGANVSVCAAGPTYAELLYSNPNNNPVSYSINYDANANNVGLFTDVTSTPLYDGTIISGFSLSIGAALFSLANADGNWHPKSPTQWSISNGSLVNNPTSPFDSEDESLFGRVVNVSTTSATGSLLSITFDYDVGNNNTLYVHLRGIDANTTGWSANIGAQNGNSWDSNTGGTTYNLWNGDDCAAVPTAGKAAEAVALTGSGTYSRTINLAAYTVDDVSDYGYIMLGFAMNCTAQNQTTVSNLWLGTSPDNGVSVVISDQAPAGVYTGTFTIATVTGCSTGYPFTVTLNGVPATPGTISQGNPGGTSVCTNDTGVTYTISAVAGASSYTWAVPGGATITNGQGTTKIYVDWGSGGGEVSVIANGACGSSAAKTLDVNVRNGVPNAPNVNAAYNIENDAFVADWNVLSTADGYYLDVSSDASFTDPTKWVVQNEHWDDPDKNDRAFGNLDPATYYYRLRAYNACGLSTNSATIVVSLPQVIAAWDTSDEAGGANNFGANGKAPRTYAVGDVTVGGLTRAAGVGTVGTGVADGWGGDDWQAGSKQGAIDQAEYITIVITNAPGVNVNYYALNVFTYRRDANGPQYGAVQYSKDGGTTFYDITNGLGSATLNYTSTSTDGAEAEGIPMDLDGISALQNVSVPVIFRIVNWGAGLEAGQWYIYSTNNTTAYDLAVQGTFCYTPTAYNMTGGGIKCTADSSWPSVGLAGSQANVSYQLRYDDGVSGYANQGSPIVGTGSAIDFGEQENLPGDFQVVATRLTGSGCSATMNGTVTITTGTSPGTPSGLTATFDGTGAGQIDLAWTLNNPAPQSFTVHRSTDNVNFSEIATVPGPGPATTYSDTTIVRNNITYYYKIKAHTIVGCDSNFSNTDSDTTDSNCQSGVAPTLTEPGNITVISGNQKTYTITGSDSSSACANPTITHTVISHDGPVFTDFVTWQDTNPQPGTTRRVYTISPAGNGAHHGTYAVQVKVTDAEALTDTYTFMLFVGNPGEQDPTPNPPASLLDWQIGITAVNTNTGNSTEANVSWDSTATVKYDLYSTTTPLGAGPSWVKEKAGVEANAASTTDKAVGNGQMRFYQVTYEGQGRSDNGVWGIVRPSLPVGVTFLSPPLNINRSFDTSIEGSLGQELAKTLPVGTDLYLLNNPDNDLQANATWTRLEFMSDGNWKLNGSTLYQEELPAGQGMLVVREAGTESPTFTGPVGNDGTATHTLSPGFNIIGLSQGKALPASTAFDSVSTIGSYDETQADMVYILEGTKWRRLIRRPDGTWYDTATPNSKGETSLILMPGDSYYYIRRSGGNDDVINF